MRRDCAAAVQVLWGEAQAVFSQRDAALSSLHEPVVSSSAVRIPAAHTDSSPLLSQEYLKGGVAEWFADCVSAHGYDVPDAMVLRGAYPFVYLQ